MGISNNLKDVESLKPISALVLAALSGRLDVVKLIVAQVVDLQVRLWHFGSFQTLDSLISP